MENQKVVIFDLDGTLADCQHREHYIKESPKNWDMFYSECDKDTVIESTASIFRLLKRNGYKVDILTGRRDTEHTKTMKWLMDNDLLPHTLRMRPARQWCKDTQLKQEWLDKYYSIDEIKGWFEDRKQVVDMVRSNGITCYQVADGDF